MTECTTVPQTSSSPLKTGRIYTEQYSKRHLWWFPRLLFDIQWKK